MAVASPNRSRFAGVSRTPVRFASICTPHMFPPAMPPNAVASMPHAWRRVSSPPEKYSSPPGFGSAGPGMDGNPFAAYMAPRLVRPRRSAENVSGDASEIVRMLAVS